MKNNSAASEKQLELTHKTEENLGTRITCRRRHDAACRHRHDRRRRPHTQTGCPILLRLPPSLGYSEHLHAVITIYVSKSNYVIHLRPLGWIWSMRSAQTKKKGRIKRINAATPTDRSHVTMTRIVRAKSDKNERLNHRIENENVEDYSDRSRSDHV